MELYFLIRFFKYSKPLLGNPNLFIIALSLLSLNTLGFSFPIWNWGVTVPISEWDKPNLSILWNTSPSLSKPAASPIGCLKSILPSLILRFLELVFIGGFLKKCAV